MVYQEIVYGIKCDRCGRMHEGCDETRLFVDEMTAVEDVLQNEEWRVMGKKHYCPNCWIPNPAVEDECLAREPLPEHVKRVEKVLHALYDCSEVTDREDCYEFMLYLCGASLKTSDVEYLQSMADCTIVEVDKMPKIQVKR